MFSIIPFNIHFSCRKIHITNWNQLINWTNNSKTKSMIDCKYIVPSIGCTRLHFILLTTIFVIFKTYPHNQNIPTSANLNHVDTAKSICILYLCYWAGSRGFDSAHNIHLHINSPYKYLSLFERLLNMMHLLFMFYLYFIHGLK